MKNQVKVLFLVNTKFASHSRGSASFKSDLLLRKTRKVHAWISSLSFGENKGSWSAPHSGLAAGVLSGAGGEGAVPILRALLKLLPTPGQ